jgi:hypothetical protein
MRWPAEAVWEQVAPLLPGFTVEVLPEIDSTNTELMRRARAGQPTRCCWWPSGRAPAAAGWGAWHGQPGAR